MGKTASLGHGHLVGEGGLQLADLGEDVGVAPHGQVRPHTGGKGGKSTDKNPIEDQV